MADAAVAAELIKPRPEEAPLELSSAQASPSFAATSGGAWSVHRYHPYRVDAVLFAQAGCLLLYTVCLSLWVYAEWLTYRRRCAYYRALPTHPLLARRLLSPGPVWRPRRFYTDALAGSAPIKGTLAVPSAMPCTGWFPMHCTPVTRPTGGRRSMRSWHTTRGAPLWTRRPPSRRTPTETATRRRPPSRSAPTSRRPASERRRRRRRPRTC